MADFDNMDVMETEEFVEEGGRDLSTIAGVAIIGGASVVVYEGGKRIAKFVAPKVKGAWAKLRGKGGEAEVTAVDPSQVPVQEAKTE